MKKNKIENMQELDDQVVKIATNSIKIFQEKSEGNSQLNNLFQLIEQYEYIKHKIECKPEYLKQFVKNYQELFGILTMSIGMNANLISNEMKTQNNARLQAEFNKLEQFKRALLLGFEKQILIYMENQQQNEQVKSIVEQSISYLKQSNRKDVNKNQEKLADPITIFSFENDANLREHIKNKSKSQPIILITTRSNLLNNSTFEFFDNQNSTKFLRLESILCICKPEKLENTKRSFSQCTIPIILIDQLGEIEQRIYDIVNKNQFLRIISLEDIQFYMARLPVNYFQEQIKKLQNSNTTLYSYKNRNYKAIFNEIATFIKDNDISVYKENYDEKAISLMCNRLSNQVFVTQNEEQLAANFIYFYTQETPFYKLINSCLNVLNEELIQKIEPIITPLYLALTKAQQQENSAFMTTKESTVYLYRGSTIPAQSLDLISKNKQLIFPAFSSFTTSEDIAEKFMKNTKSDPDSIRVLFVAKFKKNTQNPNNNPKYLKFLSAIKSEEEYLLPPFTLFKVVDNKQTEDTYRVFLEN